MKRKDLDCDDKSPVLNESVRHEFVQESNEYDGLVIIKPLLHNHWYVLVHVDPSYSALSQYMKYTPNWITIHMKHHPARVRVLKHWKLSIKLSKTHWTNSESAYDHYILLNKIINNIIKTSLEDSCAQHQIMDKKLWTNHYFPHTQYMSTSHDYESKCHVTEKTTFAIIWETKYMYMFSSFIVSVLIVKHSHHTMPLALYRPLWL